MILNQLWDDDKRRINSQLKDSHTLAYALRKLFDMFFRGTPKYKIYGSNRSWVFKENLWTNKKKIFLAIKNFIAWK